MTSILSLRINNRDFSTPIIHNLQPDPIRLSWSAYGGPRDALIHLHGDPNHLINAASWLRASVTLSDPSGFPSWWGFINKVIIHLEGTRFSISLDDLFNRVKVSYSYTSPDHQVAETLETPFADNYISQQAYGTKEKVLFYTNIDEHFAEAARDTFLNLHAFPKSKLDTRIKSSKAYVALYCSGWFQTFAWKSYINSQGFYANYGPGPGVHPFAQPTSQFVIQSFKPLIACNVKHVYFRINKVGSPANDPQVLLFTDSGGFPNTLLGSSALVPRATIPAIGYSWFRFTFASPVALTANNQHWAILTCSSTDAANYYQVRTDETNENAQNFKKAMYYTGATWANIPNVTAPGNLVSLYYRVIAIEDTGSQIAAIAAAGDQFFNHIWTPTTNINTCPYTQDEATCLNQLHKLMSLGTSNGRLVLAFVSPERNLTFYQQPQPHVPTAYLTKSGDFYTAYGGRLPAWRPPVGQFAILANTPRLTMPFDKNRTPTCFVRDATYYPGADRLLING